MQQLTLFRAVGALKRVALGDLADGVEYFTAEKAEDGTITLTPVNIVGQAKRAAAEDEDRAEPAEV